MEYRCDSKRFGLWGMREYRENRCPWGLAEIRGGCVGRGILRKCGSLGLDLGGFEGDAQVRLGIHVKE